MRIFSCENAPGSASGAMDSDRATMNSSCIQMTTMATAGTLLMRSSNLMSLFVQAPPRLWGHLASKAVRQMLHCLRTLSACLAWRYRT